MHILPKYECEIAINGLSIDVNEFVTRIFSNTIIGMISSLDGLPPEHEKIEIKIKKSR
ncbi:MAG: hypothetical protein ACE5OZ_12935 [Candidatus Heimdallarchaeota archaeon]